MGCARCWTITNPDVSPSIHLLPNPSSLSDFAPTAAEAGDLARIPVLSRPSCSRSILKRVNFWGEPQCNLNPTVS